MVHVLSMPDQQGTDHSIGGIAGGSNSESQATCSNDTEHRATTLLPSTTSLVEGAQNAVRALFRQQTYSSSASEREEPRRMIKTTEPPLKGEAETASGTGHRDASIVHASLHRAKDGRVAVVDVGDNDPAADHDEEEAERVDVSHAISSAFLFNYFVAGGAAGATSRTVVSPLERLKIIMQIQPHESASTSGTGAKAKSSAKGAYSGVVSGLMKMWREEGFSGFMRGNGINCLRIAPYSAVQFTTYESAKNYLRDADGELDVTRKLTAGAVAGIASVVSTYPLDLVRSRISVASASLYSDAKSIASAAASASATKQGAGVAEGVEAKVLRETLAKELKAKQKKVPGMMETAKKVYREEGGVKGLYRGCIPTSIGVAPYVALNFFFYEAARKKVTPADGGEPSALMKLACGALAGSISQTLTFPFEVLRRRMQFAGMKSKELGFSDKGAIDAVRNILKKEGLRGMYRGLIPNLLKVAPSIGTSFLTYETVVHYLEPLNHP
ncbi:mitochondrial carrier [Violaceomyces palustris]|uniref:Mitochondrial carrier n=1 Tax=Violaceomyces palustris TaxID=1673888 RepID=A0ACD0P6M6_9BASI|nr:mitochondrial carrier [Violaceomyces palustris]